MTETPPALPAPDPEPEPAPSFIVPEEPAPRRGADLRSGNYRISHTCRGRI